MDGIAPKIIKIVAKELPETILGVMNKLLRDRNFPEIWKKARLVLIPKPNKTPGLATSYRPICMLDTLGKLYERLIGNRLLEEIKNAGDLSDRQFGFREGRSTIMAAEGVLKLAQ